MDVEREREQCRQVDARQHSGASMGAVAEHGAADPEAATAGEVGKHFLLRDACSERCFRPDCTMSWLARETKNCMNICFLLPEDC